MRKRIFASGLASILVAGIGCSNAPPVFPCFNKPIYETPIERVARLGKERKGCVEVIKGHNDVREKRINIVFVGVDYPNRNILVRRVYEAAGCDKEGKGLFCVEPYISNTDLFNLWYVPKIARVSGKFEEGVEAWGNEAKKPGWKAAESCDDLPNKAVFILVNRNFRSNAHFSPLRYLNLEEMNLENIGSVQSKCAGLNLNECKARVNECKENGSHPLCADIAELRGEQSSSRDEYICSIIIERGNVPFSFSLISAKKEISYYLIGHESGHLILGLRDEYEDAKYFNKYIKKKSKEKPYLQELKDNPVNCFPARTKKECERNAPWADLVGKEDGIGCFLGCSYTKSVNGMPIWRSIEKSMMRNSGISSLGAYNMRRSCLSLEVITQNAGGICEDHGFSKDEPKRYPFLSPSFSLGEHRLLDGEDDFFKRGF